MWKERFEEIWSWYKDRSEKRDELRVFNHYFPNPVAYNGILSKVGEKITEEEKQLIGEAGATAESGHYEKELTPNGFQFKVEFTDPEVVEYLKANHGRMVGFVTYDDGKNIRFPGTRTVEVQESTFVYTFPDLKQDINPISFYVHALPVEGPNVPHPKFWRLGFRLSSPANAN